MSSQDKPPADIAPLSTEDLGGLMGSLGLVLLLVDRDLRILHAIGDLEALGSSGGAEALAGSSTEALLGRELCGAEGHLRQALLKGRRSEEWRAEIRLPDRPPRAVWVSAGPISEGALGPDLDHGVRYVLALRTISEADSSTRIARVLPAAADAHAARNPQSAGERGRGGHASDAELRRALDAHHWRRSEAARALGISRTTLWRRMRDLGWLP